MHQILVSQSRRQVFPCTYNREYERSVRSGGLAEKKRLYFFQKILVWNRSEAYFSTGWRMPLFCAMSAARLSQRHGGSHFTKRSTRACRRRNVCIVGRNSQINQILTTTKPKNTRMQNTRKNSDRTLYRGWLRLVLRRPLLNWCFTKPRSDLGWPVAGNIIAANVTNLLDSNLFWTITWKSTKKRGASA